MLGKSQAEVMPEILMQERALEAARTKYHDEQMSHMNTIAAAVRAVLPPIDWESVRNECYELEFFTNNRKSSHTRETEAFWLVGKLQDLQPCVELRGTVNGEPARVHSRSVLDVKFPYCGATIGQNEFEINGKEFISSGEVRGLDDDAVNEVLDTINLLGEAEWGQQKLDTFPFINYGPIYATGQRQYRERLEAAVNKVWLPYNAASVDA